MHDLWTNTPSHDGWGKQKNWLQRLKNKLAKDKATLVMEALSVKSVTLTVEVDSLKLKLEEKESKINALKSELAEVRLENYKSILRDFDGLSRIGKIRFLTTIIDGRPIKDAHQNIHLKAGA